MFLRLATAGGPANHHEGAPSKLVLLGWGFFRLPSHCPMGEMRKSGGGLMDRVLKRAELHHPSKGSLGGAPTEFFAIQHTSGTLPDKLLAPPTPPPTHFEPSPRGWRGR